MSILLPNLNNRRFLDERAESIFAQTLRDWELVVVDNYSEDGAWDFFQQLSRRDNRVRISQAAREGMYANWNNCIRQANGRFIYIATSDDNMAPDCLERLSNALESHPQCDLAHCKLKIFDENGREAANWWSSTSMFALSSHGLLDRTHERLAPHDGLLHLSGASVYISITQLLARRSLFERIGQFPTQWGSVGDFHWCMRAGLTANTVHVPGTWGGWRVYSGQATAAANLGSREHCRKVDEMTEDAVAKTLHLLPDVIRTHLTDLWAPRARELRELYWEFRHAESQMKRRQFLLRKLANGSWAARQHVKCKLLRQPIDWPETAPRMVADWLQSAGVGPRLIPGELAPAPQG